MAPGMVREGVDSARTRGSRRGTKRRGMGRDVVVRGVVGEEVRRQWRRRVVSKVDGLRSSRLCLETSRLKGILTVLEDSRAGLCQLNAKK